jgi:site-specific DNA-methyltransferase (adenine-specific)
MGSEQIMLYNDDNMAVLKAMEDNSIGSIVSDIPYGIRFMGRKWDYDVPSVETWRECLRVLKPGGHMAIFCGTRTQHRAVINIEDAGFEIRDVISWIYGCLRSTAQVLTRDGWKFYYEIKEGDLILTWSGKELVESKINKITAYEYNGKMINFKNHNTSQIITSNHRVYKKNFVRKSVNGIRKGNWEENWNVKEARELDRHTPLRLPLSSTHNGKGIGEDYSELLGWVFTEGGYDKEGTGVRIYQSSVNMPNIVRIQSLLKKLKISHKEYKRDRVYKDRTYIEFTWFISGEEAKRIRKLLPDKNPTFSLLFSMSYEDKKRFFESSMLGDGSKGNNQFYQKDKESLEWFQTLIHLIGFSGKINYKKSCVSFQHRDTTDLISRTLVDRESYYNGVVWCPSVDEGAFITKDEGYIFITGNSGFPKSFNISNGIEGTLVNGSSNTKDFKKLDGVDTKKGLGFVTTNFEQGNRPNNYNTYGTYKTEINYTTKEAKEWEGWGTALKPACEFITICRKPISEKNIALNVLKWGVGGINIDASRIELNGEVVPINRLEEWSGFGELERPEYVPTENTKGRFPANVIFDEEAGKLLDEQTGIYQSPRGIYGKFNNGKGLLETRGDSGGASRFFYCAKASGKEKDFGLDGFEIVESGTGALRDNGRGKSSKNFHPTVKPIELMKYIVRLVTPPKETCLDLYMGSGSTVIASKLLGISAIGIEQDSEYFHIAKSRVDSW